MAGNDGCLDVAAAVQHVAEHFLQTGERSFTGNVIGGADFFGGDQAKRAAYGFRRVMERSLQRDFGIVRTISTVPSHASGRPTASITTSQPRFCGESARTASTTF